MRISRLLLMMALAIAAVAALAAPAAAHAAYKSSDPPDEGQVSSPPTEVTATFTEPLANGSFLQITDPCGQRVDDGDVRIVGYDMTVNMEGTAAGPYRVFYRAFSTLDPHVTEGTFGFTSTGGEACPGDEPRAAESASGRRSSAATEPGSPTKGHSSSHGGPPRASQAGDPATAAGPRGRSRPSAAGKLTGDSRTRSSGSSEELEGERLAAGEEDKAEAPSVWDGIRLEPFLMGLLLAAIIGAAGGKMYAGIMGPRA